MASITSINRFGTTKDMIVQEIQEGEATYLLAIDVKGFYFTTPDKVDTQLADVNRYAVDRQSFTDRLTQLGFSPVDMFEEHKGKIQVISQTIKKVNPIKASKRKMG